LYALARSSVNQGKNVCYDALSAHFEEDAVKKLAVLFSLSLAFAPAQTLPDEVVFTAPGLLPEGIEYDANAGHFLVGSLSQGTISAVADDGAITPFIEDEALMSTVGIRVDEARGRLLVTNSDASAFADPTLSGRAGLLAYSLETGERLFNADLASLVTTEGARFFANDVAVDEEGNAYVTNSFAPVLFRISPDGAAEVFVEDERLTADFVGMNGIVVHPGGYLLVAVTGNLSLFKIPLDDPAALTEVTLSEPFAVDGMVLAEDGSLVAVAYVGTSLEGATPGLIRVTSEDDWETADIAARLPTGGNATTVALRDGTPYYINAYLDDPAREQYEIVRADFKGE
jgi:sugar lactone lactonase YvrE